MVGHKQTLRGTENLAYSITSSAVASMVGRNLRPSALAVLRLSTNLNLVGCCTGKSPAFAMSGYPATADIETTGTDEFTPWVIIR